MNWLHNLSIRNKVSVIAAIGVIGFLAFLALNYRLTNRVQQELLAIISSDLPTLQFSNELQAGFSAIEKGFQASLMEADEAALDRAVRQARELSDRFIEVSHINPAEAAALEKLHDSLKEYVTTATAQNEAILRGENMDSTSASQGFDRVEEARAAYETLQQAFINRWFERFNQRITAIQTQEKEIITIGITIGITVSLMLLLVSLVIIRLITEVLSKAVAVANQIAGGNLHQDIDATGKDETGQLMHSLRVMRDALLEQNTANRERDEQQQALAGLNEVMRGDQSLDALANNILRYLANQLDACIGAFYLYRDDSLQLFSSYAFQYRRGTRNRYEIGETIVGQCALERKAFVVSDLPDDYIKIGSGIGLASPRSIIVLPVLFNGELRGVLELGSFRNFGDRELQFLTQGAEGIGIAINSAESRIRLQEMLQQTKEQADILQSQQQEMETINRELEARTAALDKQKNEILQKNQELERSKKVLMEKSEALEASGRYKTQFLSTMSHELRTPLNSILILSQALMDNRSGNLSPKDVEHASVINASGSDLLSLINDILDLSKVEEGKMELVNEDIDISSMAADIDKRFKYIAQNKGLEFSVTVEPDVAPQLHTDIHRLNQVLKNFISNAIKFTDKGGVYVTVHRPRPPFLPMRPGLNRNEAVVIAVRDTGTGIPKDKQDIIFEAFKQADGTTSRKYGGTGLGLTISRELAHLLGGEISVFSEGEGTGSTFGVILPLHAAEAGPGQPLVASKTLPAAAVPDSLRSRAQPTDKLLIVEDDVNFAHILSDMIADAGLACDVMHNGQDALLYLEHYLPQAVILDLTLPDMPGWDIIKKIKSTPESRNIPVHVVSATPARFEAASLGAADFTEKPVSQDDVAQLLSHIKEEISGSFQRVLIVEDNVALHEVITDQFASRGMDAQFVETGAAALANIARHTYECLIVDLKLPDGDGLDLLKKIRALDTYAATPVIVFTAEELSAEREFEISKYADRVILKSNQAMERLLDATQVFLRAISPEPSQPEAAAAPEETPAAVADFTPHRQYGAANEKLLAGCKVLLVDDDIRNIYSMSAILEDFGMDVVPAMSGVEALEKIGAEPDFHVVLMDIMMPEMDGYEAIHRIRQLPGLQGLTIIALTAKAMQEDRQHCLDAGASDYLPKPVDVDLLKRMLSTWIAEAASTA
jgi:CheY-like chemotaxis protein/HAMP domain-containing protein